MSMTTWSCRINGSRSVTVFLFLVTCLVLVPSFMNMSVAAKTETDTSLSNMDEFDYSASPTEDYDYGPTPPVVDAPDTDKPTVTDDGGGGKDTDTNQDDTNTDDGDGGKDTNKDDGKNTDTKDTDQDQQQEESVAPIQQPIVIDQGVAVVPAVQNQPVLVVSPAENVVDQAPRPEIVLVVPEADVMPVAMAPMSTAPSPSSPALVPPSSSSRVHGYGGAFLSAPWNALVVMLLFMHMLF